MAKIAAENKPVNGYFFSLCEYSQIRKIYTVKKNAALHDTKKANPTPTKLSRK
jgi:hypothetical protein